MSENDTVTIRMRNICTTIFQFKMREQEANVTALLMKTVDYIA